eukprot:4651162-Lingulodinium_polyedra.AAC.1
MPSRVLDCIGRHVAGGEWAQDARVVCAPCRCSLKTQVIPQHSLDVWRAAMVHSPFGPGIVASEGRYLGAWL